jgi:trehalose 6-phosphate synthase/phosphatase
MDSQRTVIVSNRLPFTAQAGLHGIDLVPGIGGLATGLRSLHEQRDSVWIGWPGDLSTLPRRLRRELDAIWADRRIVPVPIRLTESRAFHDAFCSGVLWPLFHYQLDRIPSESTDWELYREVNTRFADAIASTYEPGDVIWIHDYHLLLVPGLLRQRLPDAAIGFFLHVPFPAADVFRVLPWRREILEGMLGASLVGFHTETYASHFMDAVRRLSVHSLDRRRVNVGERTVEFGAYPMGVDVEAFGAPTAHTAIGTATPAVSKGEKPAKILLGVDRLDYTKGLPWRLMAYERLLRDNPELRGRVQMIQVAVPCRAGVASYQQFRHEVEELVGRINGALGTVDWTPIAYLHQSVSTEQLIALYRSADVMLVTPLRDGMNLVAKEFVAARSDGDGVLVLSEFAGASEELHEALSVNPYLIEEVAAAMARALAMPEVERRVRMGTLRRRVSLNDRNRWAGTFLRDLTIAAGRERARQESGFVATRFVSAPLPPVQAPRRKSPASCTSESSPSPSSGMMS